MTPRAAYSGHVRRGLGIMAAASLVVLLAGCAPAAPAEGDWIVTTIEMPTPDDGLPDDITAPLRHLTPDRAGGVWGVADGIFVHVAADGSVTRADMGDEHGFTRVDDIAMLTQTTLAVTQALPPEGADVDVKGSLWTFDTTSAEWTSIEVPRRPGMTTIGDLAAAGDEIVFVDQTWSAKGEPRFRLRAVDIATNAVRDLAPTDPDADAFPGGSVVIDADADGRIHVASTAGVLMVGMDGEVLLDEPQPLERPYTAVSAEGRAVTSTDPSEAAEVGVFVDGGSQRARELLTGWVPGRSECTPLVIGADQSATRFPIACSESPSIAWIDEATLIVSADVEGQGVLARVSIPMDPRG